MKSVSVCVCVKYEKKYHEENQVQKVLAQCLIFLSFAMKSWNQHEKSAKKKNKRIIEVEEIKERKKNNT